ncbi:MAG: hypothetical protein WCH52_10155, partial [Bacteroidota bacterium]
MNNQFKRHLQLNLIFLDLIMLVCSFIIPRLLFQSRISSSTIYAYLFFGSYSLISWALFTSILGNYTEKIIIQFETFTKRTLQVFLLWI